MARRRQTAKGQYEPANPEKYKGSYPIVYRSSWELTMMRYFDKHPDVAAWASETIQIPYMHPVKKKVKMYIPDFFVVYVDKNGKKRQEIIEVKPAGQASLKEAKSTYQKVSLAINTAKWNAAQQWCSNRNLRFRVITENDMFNKPKK
jgi:hypothetical protein